MTTYVLELRSTADYKDVRYREYTTSKRKADLFAKVPRISFTDSGHGIVPYVREHSGRREPRNMILRNHVVASIKTMTQRESRLAATQAGAEVGVEELALMLCSIRGFGYYTDPMEGGQDAYDISCEADNDARALLAEYRITKRGK